MSAETTKKTTTKAVTTAAPETEPFEVSIADAIVTTRISTGVRDPFILYYNGKYYLYGTGFNCWITLSKTLARTWTSYGTCVSMPTDNAGDWWAPEVYIYNDTFYMFATYKVKSTGKRGVGVFKAKGPIGPFTLVSDGVVTPSDWDAIDGTLYVDPDGQPWMIFVHEWTSTNDHIGRFAAAKMSADLTHFISEPVELFRADDAPWNRTEVTDGCFMYRTQDGQLLMLWSSNNSEGYCVGISRSVSGNVLGPWTHDTEMLFTKSMTGYAGGHGSLFYDANGKLWMVVHSPNGKIGDRLETPVCIPLKEENGTLVWDLMYRAK